MVSQQDVDGKAVELLAVQDRLKQSSSSQLALQQQLHSAERELQQRQDMLNTHIANADAYKSSSSLTQQKLQTELDIQLTEVSGSVTSSAACVLCTLLGTCKLWVDSVLATHAMITRSMPTHCQTVMVQQWMCIFCHKVVSSCLHHPQALADGWHVSPTVHVCLTHSAVVVQP